MEELRVMADYSSEGLWINGWCTDIEDILPSGFIHLKKRILNWVYLYESFWKFEVYNNKLYKKKLFYKKFIKEGLEISFCLKNILLNSRYTIYYFNEKNLKHILISKRIILKTKNKRKVYK